MLQVLLFIVTASAATIAAEQTTTSPIIELTNAAKLETEGNVRESERIIRSVLSRRDLQGTIRFQAETHLGLILIQSTRYDEAELTLRHALDSGMHDSAISEAMRNRTRMNLAALYAECRDPKQTQRQLDQVTHPELLKDFDRSQYVSLQASLAMLNGDFRQAHQLYVDDLELLRSIGASGSIEAATALNNLGTLAIYLKDPHAAVRYLTEASSLWRQIVGVQHTSLLRTLANLAIAQENLKDYTSAGVTLEECLTIARDRLGLSSSFTAALYGEYGAVLAKLGRKQESKQMKSLARQARRNTAPDLPRGAVVDVSAFQKP